MLLGARAPRRDLLIDSVKMAGAVSTSAQLRLTLSRTRNHTLRSINKRTIVSDRPFNLRPVLSYSSLQKTTPSLWYQFLGQPISYSLKTRGFSSSARWLEQYHGKYTYPSFVEERRLALVRYPHLENSKASARYPTYSGQGYCGLQSTCLGKGRPARGASVGD